MIFSTIDEIISSGKKYSIIYQDPPWHYNDKALAGNRGACCKYNVLTNEQLYNLGIGAITATDCINFMWVTFPKIQEGLNLMRQQGFLYKTVAFNWVKHYKNGKLFLGMGRWSRANAEICLLGVKGKPHRISASVRQTLEEFDEREFTEVIKSIPEQHSKKPDEVRDRIVQLCGDLPRIELFSRQAVEGWDCFGNQVEPISKH